MGKKSKALALTFAGAVAVAAGTAEAENGQKGVHGWDEPEAAEFVMEGVKTKFLYPEIHTVERDIHVDCDLLVRDGEKRLGTVGFIMQFNAETQATVEQLSPQAYGLLQTWRGSLDYRRGKLEGTLTHTDGQHDIGMELIGPAARRCKEEFPDHGFDINRLEEIKRDLQKRTGKEHPNIIHPDHQRKGNDQAFLSDQWQRHQGSPSPFAVSAKASQRPPKHLPGQKALRPDRRPVWGTQRHKGHCAPGMRAA